MSKESSSSSSSSSSTCWMFPSVKVNILIQLRGPGIAVLLVATYLLLTLDIFEFKTTANSQGSVHAKNFTNTTLANHGGGLRRPAALVKNATTVRNATSIEATTPVLPQETESTSHQGPASDERIDTADNTADSDLVEFWGLEPDYGPIGPSGGMYDLMHGFWKHNPFCKAMGYEWKHGVQTNNQTASRPTRAKISFGCNELFKYKRFGSGNFISLFYAIRLAARIMSDVEVEITCPDAEETASSLILPWMMGKWSPSSPGMTAADRLEGFTLPSMEEACGSYDTAPIAHMLPAIQYEMRRMAIALVGVPSTKHPSYTWAEKHLWSGEEPEETLQLPLPTRGSKPLIPNIELDDAVLHFRCGDLMDSNHGSFGFMKYEAFSKRISPDAKSIGIVTQPFSKGNGTQQVRDTDIGTHSQKGERCRIVVEDMVEYLQERWPKARISVHNDDDETIALAFARMVMANETVAGITSFGVFPAISTFGTGYVRKPDYGKAPNRWLIMDPTIEDLADNVVLAKESPPLRAPKISNMWRREEKDLIIKWFRDPDYIVRRR